MEGPEATLGVLHSSEGQCRAILITGMTRTFAF